VLLSLLIGLWLVSALSGGQSADTQTRMQLYNRALGVECTHCHVDGQWADASKPAFATAAKMATMVEAINGRLALRDRVGCWTCHGGAARPMRQPRPLFDEQLAKWPRELTAAPEPLKVTMTVYNVALGVGCDHCHVPGDWKDRSKRAMKTLETMNALFEIFPKYMPATARTQCYMCHKGSIRPAPARANPEPKF